MTHLKLAAALLALTLSAPQAKANDEIVYLPEGEIELADILSPAEIAAEIMNSDGYEELDAVPTASKPRLVVKVSKKQQRLWVYEDGRETGSWKVSTGTGTRKCAPTGRCYIANTPVGTFTPKSMHYNYTSNLWKARMDRAIFFRGGIALHATYGDNIALLGSRASGGCIRQSPDNADKLFRLVKHYGMKNTRITVSN